MTVNLSMQRFCPALKDDIGHRSHLQVLQEMNIIRGSTAAGYCMLIHFGPEIAEAIVSMTYHDLGTFWLACPLAMVTSLGPGQQERDTDQMYGFTVF